MNDWFINGRVIPVPNGVCQHCATTGLRWHIPLVNRRTGAELVVGKECAANLCVPAHKLMLSAILRAEAQDPRYKRQVGATRRARLAARLREERAKLRALKDAQADAEAEVSACQSAEARLRTSLLWYRRQIAAAADELQKVRSTVAQVRDYAIADLIRSVSA